MNRELKATGTALLAGLFVVGASWGAAALIGPHVHKKHDRKGQPGNSSGDSHPAPVAMASLVSTGRGFYVQSCASCHGDNAQGGIGPNLQGLGDTDTEVATVIKNGIKGQMPAFGDKYDANQQKALVAYVQSLSK